MNIAHLRNVACGIAALATLAGCADSLPKAVGLQRENRLKLQENISTKQDVIALTGKPDDMLDVPRLAVPAAVRDQCMKWDQRAIRAIFYFDTYLNKSDNKAWEQETQVFLTSDDRVCTWVVWTWLKGWQHDEKMTIKG